MFLLFFFEVKKINKNCNIGNSNQTLNRHFDWHDHLLSPFMTEVPVI